MLRTIFIYSVFLLNVLMFPTSAQTSVERLPNGYSIEPYKNAVFDEVKVAVETVVFNNWLLANISNIQKMTHEQVKGPREHLYYLIDSRIKHLYALEKSLLPKKDDLILQMLFSWSEQLGVYGGSYAFNAVKGSSSSALKPSMKPPAGISMNLSNDLFTIQSELGWTLKFPYNFMTWNVQDFNAIGGSRNQMVVLSTGAAKDNGQLGHSQATLMFFFSPNADQVAFEKYWREKVGILSETKPKPLGLNNLQSHHEFNYSQALHTEITSWSNAKGAFVVTYSGNSGTYEANRQHFIDFLRINTDSAPQNYPK
jgi:hypothetical protein